MTPEHAASSRKRRRDDAPVIVGCSDSGSDAQVCSSRQPEATEALETCASRTPAAGPCSKGSRLRKGMVILKGFLSKQEQRDLVAHIQRLGELGRGGFYACNNEKTKRMRMMNLGLKTDGRKHVLEIPQEWRDMAVRACRDAGETDPSLSMLLPNICVVNHYTAESRLGWHQDVFSARDAGLPVVSLSLGQAATFQYRVSWKKNAEVKAVRLESGDALVFGGRSRGIIHSVPELHISSALSTNLVSKPEGLGQNLVSTADGHPDGHSGGHWEPAIPGGGRFNLNFREL